MDANILPVLVWCDKGERVVLWLWSTERNWASKEQINLECATVMHFCNFKQQMNQYLSLVYWPVNLVYVTVQLVKTIMKFGINA